MVAERQSPTFDMFNNHPRWSETLKPGEEGVLRIAFDPNYHGPEGIGLQEKAIRLTAGDIRNPLAEVRVKATVVEDLGTENAPGAPKAHSHGRKGRH